MKLTSLTQDELAELEASVVQMDSEGMTLRAIMAATGLNHSQAELILIRNSLAPEAYERFAAGGTTLAERVVAARQANEVGFSSWGVIGVLAGEPESKVRKAFADATGNKSQGLRIGHGGRFYYGDDELYQDVLQPTGTTIPVGAKHEQARTAARVQRIHKLDMDQLKELGEFYNVEFKRGMTKTTLARKIIKAIEGEGTLSQDEAAELVS